MQYLSPNIFSVYGRLSVPTADSFGKVSLFVYDNGTCLVESFRDEPVDVALDFGLDHAALEDVVTGEVLPGEVRTVMRRWTQPPEPHHRAASFRLPPHSFRAFRLK